MKLVTVATHSERYFPYLKLSAEKYGHDLAILGWGEKWQGLTWKFQLMKDYLKSIPKDEIVCFVDAYDVVVLQTPDTIEGTYLKCVNNDRDKILISKEQYSYNGSQSDLLTYLVGLVFTKCHEEYINSGTYVGTAGGLSHVFEQLCNEFTCSPKMNDQRLLQDYCAKHGDLFVVDSDCKVFLVINSTLTPIKEGEYDITMKHGKLVYKGDTYPAFFHGNGFTNFDYIIQELGYDPDIFRASNESNAKYIWDSLKHYVPMALKGLWLYILLISIAIVYVYRKTILRFMKSKGILPRSNLIK